MISFIAIPWPSLWLPLLASFLVSWLVTRLLLRYGRWLPAWDKPSSRRWHKVPRLRLGGLAMFLGFLPVALLFVPLTREISGFLLALSFIFLVGLIDDFKELPGWPKLAVQLAAVLILIGFGIRLSHLTNPFGGVIELSFLLGALLTVIWVLWVMNAVNFLDGMDGLAGSISFIAALVLALLSWLSFVNQPSTALLALILAAATLGFLVFNFPPARIFMGDAGSYFLGFTLAVLAIISGGKIATAALVLGLPLVDFVWAVGRRLWQGKSPLTPDLEHLHHRLLARLSPRATLALLVAFSLLFGSLALISGTQWKIALFALLTVVVLLVTSWLGRKG